MAGVLNEITLTESRADCVRQKIAYIRAQIHEYKTGLSKNELADQNAHSDALEKVRLTKEQYEIAKARFDELEFMPYDKLETAGFEVTPSPSPSPDVVEHKVDVFDPFS